MKVEPVPVRRAVAGDEPILRDLRLQAMRDSPDAFGSTYERELARTTLDWQRWLSPGATFLLGRGSGAAGLVAAQQDPNDATVVQLMAMWVHPVLRGTGAADALVQAVVAWSEAAHATTIRLEVIKTNLRAQRCYERNGFRLTGEERARESDGRVEATMERVAGPFTASSAQ
jgi:ribosomal protein S18 acetylase RimI-like enzyme